MTRRTVRLARVLSTALTAGTLLATAACAQDGGRETGASGVSASPAAARQQTESPTGSPTGSPSGTLSESGAETALITAADIEDDWTQVKDTEAENWHDGLLIGKVDVSDFVSAKADAADCQRLMDSLFDDDLLGKPSGANALRGFTQDDSRLLYQVAAYDRTDVQDSLDWMAGLPQECDQFTMTENGEERTVQVTESDLPTVGDAREGVRVSVRGPVDGTEATLTLSVAAVRVGDNAITVTAGGLDDDEDDSVESAVKLGTQRLQDVLAGKSPAASPSQFD
ncbi:MULTISPECIES: hypothetical protein [unclassified Streptomyces]|uniref:hypothetical protein n=1 Tax=unclassified Streptomyces TaxID=2593676 RepID=UPI00074AC903|nr:MULTISPECIES: hypothetical protein [unclassified Streptomyces]KUL74141.1 hypothetical protein ADL34_18505 [Streptomyces sp. NRRL WC-3605]KUL74910.1 hypothetical protein ADL33_16400 [Streptomyces sp. NRRL WC-3604]